MLRHDFDQTEFMKNILGNGEGKSSFNAADVSNIAYWIYQNAFYDGIHAARGESIESLIR
jgi:hypothetical protein